MVMVIRHCSHEYESYEYAVHVQYVIGCQAFKTYIVRAMLHTNNRCVCVQYADANIEGRERKFNDQIVQYTQNLPESRMHNPECTNVPTVVHLPAYLTFRSTDARMYNTRTHQNMFVVRRTYEHADVPITNAKDTLQKEFGKLQHEECHSVFQPISLLRFSKKRFTDPIICFNQCVIKFLVESRENSVREKRNFLFLTQFILEVNENDQINAI